MSFENQLITNKANLESLKNNLQLWTMQTVIDRLKEDWKPIMKTLEGKPYDGLHHYSLDEPVDVLYWDVKNATWTHRNAAFKSHVTELFAKYI